jgi:DNA-directed RNA polymerase subunit RPC12/RpoP
MSDVKLTGPYNCAECGTGLTMENALDGDSGPLLVNIRGHLIEIPGLYACTPCAGAIMVGEKQSQVTYQAANAFLNDEYGPRLCSALLMGEDSPVDVASTLTRLQDVLEVQFILEAVIQLEGEPGGLEFIPECDGSHESHQAHPRDVASMN